LAGFHRPVGYHFADWRTPHQLSNNNNKKLRLEAHVRTPKAVLPPEQPSFYILFDFLTTILNSCMLRGTGRLTKMRGRIMISARELTRGVVVIGPVAILVSHLMASEESVIDKKPERFTSVVAFTNKGKAEMKGVTFLPAGSIDITAAVYYELRLPMKASLPLFTTLPCGRYDLVIHFVPQTNAQIYRDVDICRMEVTVVQKPERSNLLFHVPKTFGLYHPA
jgi:hypothetical protein